MDTSFTAWGVYMAALALHWLYWFSARTRAGQVAALHRSPGLTLRALPILALSQLTLFAWPFVALWEARYSREPSPFAVVMLLGGSLAASWIVAQVLNWMLTITFALLEPGSLETQVNVSRGIIVGVVLAPPVLTAAAYAMVLSA